MDFLFTAKDAGFLRFRVAVEAARDTFNQNDRADANTIVKGEPRVLVVKGDEDVAAQLVAALKTERHQVDTVIPEALPSDLAGLADYDSIVLVDVPRIRLTDKAMAALQVYVRDLGRGLVTIGGPKAYGAGGYTDTPLEETLPVDMGVRDREKQPDVALVVVIDKSGSMDACHCNSFNGGMGGGSGIGGVRKVDIGKEAILRAASALTARDELGVVAFDQAAHWVVKTAPLGTVTDLQGAIGGIQPDGQTNIFAGLDQAVQSLKTATATRRHIILLTDGWSSSGQYDDILKQMKAAGITLSTVGAGGGANPFLEQLAHNGGGRFYAANDPSNIPDIFLKETQQVSGQQIVEEKFFPIQTSSSPILRGIEGGLPSPAGLQRHDRQARRPDRAGHRARRPAPRAVAVRPRPVGGVDLGLDRALGEELDRLAGVLAVLQPDGGLDVPGRGERRDRGVVRRPRRADVPAGRERRRGRLAARLLRDPRRARRPRPAARRHRPVPDRAGRVRDAGGVARERRVRGPRDPDQARARRPSGRTLGLVAPTAAEYRLLGANEPLLGAIRAATGGKEADTPAEVWVHDLRATSRYTDLWPLLLVLALLLWPLDIALRRVSVGRRELADARRWVGSVGRSRRVATRTTASESMLAATGRSSAARSAILREAAGAGQAGGRGHGGREPGERATAQAPSAPTPSTPRHRSPRSRSPPRRRRRRHRSPRRRPRRRRPLRRDPPPRPRRRRSPAPSGAAEPTDTLARLREAKRRTRG